MNSEEEVQTILMILSRGYTEAELCVGISTYTVGTISTAVLNFGSGGEQPDSVMLLTAKKISKKKNKSVSAEVGLEVSLVVTLSLDVVWHREFKFAM